MTNCVIYVRLSISSAEESVSIKRQLDSCRKYAEAKGWKVLGEYVDDGVSATNRHPREREAFSRLLAANGYSVVLGWSLDRFTRRLNDFVDLDRDLNEKNAAVVTVQGGFDMSTHIGRMVVQMLAVFAEYEAATIRERVKAARAHMIGKEGRRAGGRPPYGYRHVPREGGGVVLAQDPETIPWVKRAVALAQDGKSPHEIAVALTAEGAPTRAHPLRRHEGVWQKRSIQMFLTNPALAGMVAHAGDVLRGADGMPVIREGISIMTPTDWRRMCATLTAPRGKKRRELTPDLLNGILVCESCKHPLIRAVNNTGNTYRCRWRGGEECPARNKSIRREFVTNEVVRRLLGERGEVFLWTEWIDSDEEAIQDALGDIEEALDRIAFEVRQTGADRIALRLREDALLDRRDSLLSHLDDPGAGTVLQISDRTVAAAWADADGDIPTQRYILGGQLKALTVDMLSGGAGVRFKPERVSVEWRDIPTGDHAPSKSQPLELAPER
ncbi:MAG: recombinase family protein [Propionibacteriales bacterium]|nr:recombinase family protein [Propionibacteriales bacterium]